MCLACPAGTAWASELLRDDPRAWCPDCPAGAAEIRRTPNLARPRVGLAPQPARSCGRPWICRRPTAVASVRLLSPRAPQPQPSRSIPRADLARRAFPACTEIGNEEWQYARRKVGAQAVPGTDDACPRPRRGLAPASASVLRESAAARRLRAFRPR